MKRVYLIALILWITLPVFAQFNHNAQTMPNASFRSTSTMVPTGSVYSSNPMLSADGTAAYNGVPTPGPRKMRMEEGDDEITITTPGQGGSQAPLGDALIPLMIMALAFAGYIYLKRKKQNKSTLNN